MRVLLVDDSTLFLEGLRDLLTNYDLEVVGTARNGLEAQDKAHQLHPDVIVMDVQMPFCDGLTATRQIKAEMPEVDVVVLTITEDDEVLFEAIKNGASGYLLKSVDSETFAAQLKGIERGEAPLAPGLAAKILAEFARQQRYLDAQEAGAPPTTLTVRQQEVLSLVGQGLTYRQVGAKLGLTERTIKHHMREIMDRLHLNNRAAAIAYAARQGIISNEKM